MHSNPGEDSLSQSNLGESTHRSPPQYSLCSPFPFFSLPLIRRRRLYRSLFSESEWNIEGTAELSQPASEIPEGLDASEAATIEAPPEKNDTDSQDLLSIILAAKKGGSVAPRAAPEAATAREVADMPPRRPAGPDRDLLGNVRSVTVTPILIGILFVLHLERCYSVR